MHERLAYLVLNLARELGECIDSGEHPAAAHEAVRRCTACACHPDTVEAYRRLSAVRGGIERAETVYAVDSERAGAILRLELERLAGLVEVAEACLVEVFA